MTNFTPDVIQRFWSKVDTRSGACWLWMASTDTPGYGQLRVGDRLIGAHRIAYEMLVGPIPDGLVIDHLCRVPRCVNPAHMEPVTQRENVRRGISSVVVSASTTHCVHGHEYTPENTYISPKRKKRDCRTCIEARTVARYGPRKHPKRRQKSSS